MLNNLIVDDVNALFHKLLDSIDSNNLWDSNVYSSQLLKMISKDHELYEVLKMIQLTSKMSLDEENKKKALIDEIVNFK
jgi:hypothetical protein